MVRMCRHVHDAECFFDIAGLCMPWNDLQTAIGAAARYVARLLPAVIADERRLRTDPFKKIGAYHPDFCRDGAGVKPLAMASFNGLQCP